MVCPAERSEMFFDGAKELTIRSDIEDWANPTEPEYTRKCGFSFFSFFPCGFGEHLECVRHEWNADHSQRPRTITVWLRSLAFNMFMYISDRLPASLQDAFSMRSGADTWTSIQDKYPWSFRRTLFKQPTASGNEWGSKTQWKRNWSAFFRLSNFIKSTPLAPSMPNSTTQCEFWKKKKY